MKKLLSVLLASALTVGAMCFTATATETEADVSFAPKESVIEVEPGQQLVEVDYKYTKNNGWAIMKWQLVADQSVISFNPYDEAGEVAEDWEEVAYSILEMNGKKYAKLIITPNLYGLPDYNAETCGKNESILLIEGASVKVNDTTEAGADFLRLFVNIADDAKPGDYVLSAYTENETKSNNINIAKEKINVTIDSVTIRVKGSDTPDTTDTRLNVTGAQIRVPAQGSTTEKQGLRFISTLDEAFYNTLTQPTASTDTGIGFGTVVFPTKLLAEGEKLTKETTKDGKNAAIVPAVKLRETPNGSVATYTACMTDIAQDAESLTTSYTVVPYATYMDGETEVTVYGAQYATTVFDIAKAAFESKSESDYVNEYLYNEILNVVDPTTYNEPQKWSNIYKPGV